MYQVVIYQIFYVNTKFDKMYGNNVCSLNTTSNNIGNEKWKSNIILEMLDFLYGFSDYWGETLPHLCCNNMNIWVILFD